MKTNWLHPEMLLQITFPSCMTRHPKTHQRSVNTEDEDYRLLMADLMASLSQKHKKQPRGTIKVS